MHNQFLDYLEAREACRRILDLLLPLDVIIAWLRATGSTDQEIADQLSLTKQSVWQRMENAKARIIAELPEYRQALAGRSHTGSAYLADDPDLSVAQVAARFHVTRRTVLDWIHNGHLQAYRRGNQWWIPTAAILAFEPPLATQRMDLQPRDHPGRPRNARGYCTAAPGDN
jgi:excisionase family DNA binding protein